MLWDIVCVLTCIDNFEALVSFTAVYGNVTQRGGVLRDITSYYPTGGIQSFRTHGYFPDDSCPGSDVSYPANYDTKTIKMQTKIILIYLYENRNSQSKY